ncbi:MAG: tetratricopeptide repeat protein [bacterium]
MATRMNWIRSAFSLSFILIIFLFSDSWSKPILQVDKQDSVKHAIEVLKKKTSLDPQNPIPYLRLGYLYLEIAKWDTAIAVFRQCTKLDENSAEAYNGLGLAFHRKGRTSIIPVQIIMEWLKIDNYSKAEQHFMKALALKPDYLDPQYNLGVNYMFKGGVGNYEKALETFKKVLETDMEFKDTDFMLGIAYHYLKDYVNAEVVFQRMIEADRMVGKALLKLSEVYFETGREEDATNSYYEGVIRMNDPKMWDEIYAELEILMESEEQNQFKMLSIEARGSFVKKFWKRKDPVPTTAQNERLIEHYRRVDFARQTYLDAIPPFYDDRGKVYVKYGPPDSKYTSQMDGEGIKDNESWGYEKSIRKGLTFDFVKRGVGYYRVSDLADAAPLGYAGSGAQQLFSRRLYRERADFTDSYNMFLVPDDARNVMVNFQAERDASYEKAPVEVFHYEPEGRSLPFIYNLCQFRGTEGKSRTEVYLGVSNSQLSYSNVAGGLITTLNYQAVVQDSEYVDVQNQRREFSLRANSQEEIQGMLFLHQEDFALSPGKHLLALEIQNPQGNAEGLYRNEFEVRDFRGTFLDMSDIQLASDIKPSDTEGSFVKKGLRIVPYPYTVIRKDRPIFVYFEVYNLRFDPSGKTLYTVTHTVDLLEHKRSFFSKTFGAIGRLFTKGDKSGISTVYDHEGSTSESLEYISLDMGKLPKGVAQLTVTVKDNTSGEETSQSIQFELIE